MNNFEGLSKEELSNLTDSVDRIVKDVQIRPNLMTRFYSDPTAFLKSYGIKVVKYIQNVPELYSTLRLSVRQLITAGNRIANRCWRCRILALLTMLGTLGKFGIGWGSIEAKLDMLIGALKYVFEKTGKEIEKLFERIDGRVDKVRATHLAMLICRQLKYCP